MMKVELVMTRCEVRIDYRPLAAGPRELILSDGVIDIVDGNRIVACETYGIGWHLGGPLPEVPAFAHDVPTGADITYDAVADVLAVTLPEFRTRGGDARSSSVSVRIFATDDRSLARVVFEAPSACTA